MPNKIHLHLLMTIIFLYFLLLQFSLVNAQGSDKYCRLFTNSIEVYNANALNSISADHFDITQFQGRFLSFADPYHILYNAHDSTFFYEVDRTVKKDIKTAYCSLKDKAIGLLIKNTEETIALLNELLHTKLDYYAYDTIFTPDQHLLKYYKTNKKQRVKNYLKLMTVGNYFRYDTVILFTKDSEQLLDSLKVKHIEKTIHALQQNLLNADYRSQLVYEVFINSFLHQIDPYAHVFSDQHFDQFKASLSSNSEVFGIQLELTHQGKIIISGIAPGSFAWKTGRVNEGDEVLSIESGGEKLIIEGVSNINEVYHLLSDNEINNLTIRLLKTNNEIVEVDLYKEETENYENSVQAYILNGETKIGYMMLPSFYTAWNETSYFGCAQDVAKAIYYLKKEQIEGLILDIRNNGGGSIKEAIELAGIFIDFGLLSAASHKDQKITLFKDFNRGTMYNGPLALIVNNTSASASEMLAAVLQDYNRALIVGEQTFGKGVGQQIFSLEDNYKAKFTTAKYYRTTGYTFDKTGVMPDIQLPGNKRKSFDASIKVDELNKDLFYKPLDDLPCDELRLLSQKRENLNQKFSILHEMDSMRLSGINALEFIPLHIDLFANLHRKIYQVNDLQNLLEVEKTERFDIELLSTDKEMYDLYEYYANMYDSNMQQLKSDPVVEETYQILIDYKNIKNE